MPDNEATHNELCLPWMPDRQAFAIHVKGFLDSLLFAKALMINQWELANARSYGSSPVHAREDILMTSSAMPSMQSGLLRSTVGFLVLFSLASSTISAVNTAPPDAAYVDTVNKADVYLQELADARVVSGTVAVQKSGQLVYSNAFGFASEELDVPMKDSLIFPIGSNTKILHSFAVYQLQEKGLLNVTDPVNLYIDPTDFDGLGTLGWCPVLHGKEQLGCQEPSIKQLLAMTSGILPTDNMDCGTPNSTWTANDWYWQYRLNDLKLSYGDVGGATGNFFNGQETMAQQLNAQGTLRLPFLFAPGEQYCYSNANFNIMGYVIEKLSNSTFTDYVTENILKPANLTNTFYWIGGQGMEPQGLRKNVVSIPGYLTTFNKSTEDGAPAEFQMVQRTPWWEGDTAYMAAAAGAMYSTMEDLIKWYNTFTTRPEAVGLSKESLKNLTTPVQPLGIPGLNASFGQGIVATGTKNITNKLMYVGGIWGFHTHIEMWLDHADPTKSDAILYFTNLLSIIPPETNGTCAIKSPNGGSPIKLRSSACGGTAEDGGADLTSMVVDELAKMWNISSTPSDSA